MVNYNIYLQKYKYYILMFIYIFLQLGEVTFLLVMLPQPPSSFNTYIFIIYLDLILKLDFLD